MIIDGIFWNQPQAKEQTREAFVNRKELREMYSHLSEKDKTEALKKVHQYLVGPVATGEPDKENERGK